MGRIKLRQTTTHILILNLLLSNIYFVPGVVSRIILYLYFGLGIILIISGTSKIRSTFLLKSIFIYCFFSIISGILGGYFSLNTVLSTAQFIFSVVIICFLGYDELKYIMTTYLKFISYIVPISVVYSCVLIILGTNMYENGKYYNGINKIFRQYTFGLSNDLGYASFYTNSNIWALICLFAILYYFYIYVGKCRRILIGVCFVGVMLADSRAIEICSLILVMIKIVEWINARYSKRGIIVVLTGVGLSVILALVVFIPNVLQWFEKVDWAGRLEMWGIMIESVKKHPVLGIGFSVSSKTLLRNSVTGSTIGSHNSYLNILTENGIVGFIIVLFEIFYILNVILKLQRNNPYSVENIYYVARTIFLIYIPYSFVENTIMIVELRSEIWLIVCIIIEGYYLMNIDKNVASENIYLQ